MHIRITSDCESEKMFDDTPEGLLKAIDAYRSTRGQVRNGKLLFVAGRVMHPIILRWLSPLTVDRQVRRWRAAMGREADRPMSRYERCEHLLNESTYDDARLRALVARIRDDEEHAAKTLVAAEPLSAAEKLEKMRLDRNERQTRYRVRCKARDAAAAVKADVTPMAVGQHRQAYQVDVNGDTPLIRRLKQAFHPEMLTTPIQPADIADRMRIDARIATSPAVEPPPAAQESESIAAIRKAFFKDAPADADSEPQF